RTGRTQIRTNDFNPQGIPGELESYLWGALSSWCISHGLKDSTTEVFRWLQVLSSLMSHQVDGTVTTQLDTADKLIETAQEHGCRLDASDTLEYLASEKNRILRARTVLNRETNGPLRCYSLGHDAIGLALKKWKDMEEERRREEVRRQ